MHAADRWMNDRWDSPSRVRGMRWFTEHFWPIPAARRTGTIRSIRPYFVYPGMDEVYVPEPEVAMPGRAVILRRLLGDSCRHYTGIDAVVTRTRHMG